MKKIDAINILIISLALPIAEKRSNGSFSDQQLHQLKYAQGFSSSHIIVKTPKDSKYQPFNLSEKVKIYPTQSQNRYTFILHAWRLSIKIIKNNPINLITTQDPFGTGLIGYVLSRLYRIPLCVHDVCDFIDNPWWIKGKKVNYLLNFIGKKILFKANTIRVDNTDEKKKLIGLNIPSEKIWNIPFIINDARKFIDCKDYEGLRKKLLGKKYDKVMLFIGRFDKQKDLPTFFRAAKSVLEDFPKTLFVIVGAGKEEHKVKKLVEEHNIEKNVLFTGWVDYFDLPKYYKASDIFVLSSIYETSPRVLIFARLTGRPIVTTDISGARDLVEDEADGFIVPIKDYRSMSSKIKTLLKNDVLAKNMGERGRHKVEELLNEDAIMKKNLDMYHATLINAY